MSVKDGKDYLFLVWKSETTHRQYIVGQLSKNGRYEFVYCREIREALEAGFAPLIAFPDLNQNYYNDELFPVFASRLPDKKRKDIHIILKKYGLEKYDSYEFLKKSGAKLPIDNLQFIDPILDIQHSFKRNFYIAGARHYLGCEGTECGNSIQVTRGDELWLEGEPDNVADPFAVKILSEKKEHLGYVPRYYSEALFNMLHNKKKVTCYVTNVEKNNICDECILVEVRSIGV